MLFHIEVAHEMGSFNSQHAWCPTGTKLIVDQHFAIVFKCIESMGLTFVQIMPNCGILIDDRLDEDVI